MTFAVTNVAVTVGSNGISAVLTDPFGRAATSTVAVTVRDAGYGYDANGNLTNDGERAYAWDEENRLIEVRDLASGQPLLRSRYDGLSRRRERVQWEGDVGSTNRYVYDNWNVLRVLDGANNVLESYVHGPDLSGTIGGAGGIGGILSVAHAGGPWRFYHADGNGNIVLITDASEQETARIEYDPFGRVLINTANQPVRYQFSSKEYDAAVGVNYYGYRFYKPELGRWLNRDPIGERGGLNLLRFVYNDPLRWVDALGLQTDEDCPCEGGGQPEADDFGGECCPEDMTEIQVWITPSGSSGTGSSGSSGGGVGHSWIHHPDIGHCGNYPDGYDDESGHDRPGDGDHFYTLMACDEASDDIADNMNNMGNQGPNYGLWPGGQPNCAEAVCDILQNAGCDIPDLWTPGQIDDYFSPGD